MSSTVYVSASSGFETPTAAELAYRADGSAGLNFALAASANRQVEAGYKHRSAHAAVNFAVFRVNTDNEIVPATSNAGRTTFQNGGRTLRQGLEASFDGQPALLQSATSPVALRAAYTYLNATFSDGYQTLDSGGRRVAAGAVLPGIPKHQLFVEAAWRRNLPGWSAAIEWQARSRIFADDVNSAGAAATGYGVVHARASYKFRLDAIELLPFVRVENLLDRKYISSVIVNEANQRYFETAPTRRWMAGITASVRF
jgi:iron complex outermembrane receptor protein